jgi:hypothetical protein
MYIKKNLPGSLEKKPDDGVMADWCCFFSLFSFSDFLVRWRRTDRCYLFSVLSLVPCFVCLALCCSFPPCVYLLLAMGTSARCCSWLKIGRWTLEGGVEAGSATAAEERCGWGVLVVTASMERKKTLGATAIRRKRLKLLLLLLLWRFCRVWLVLVDISLKTRPKLSYNNDGRLLQLLINWLAVTVL